MENAASDGGPGANIYVVRYEVVSDLVMNISFHYTSEYVMY